ncbi:hypothetical protein GCM10028868_31000 [Virgibacillus kimchii]
MILKRRILYGTGTSRKNFVRSCGCFSSCRDYLFPVSIILVVNDKQISGNRNLKFQKIAINRYNGYNLLLRRRNYGRRKGMAKALSGRNSEKYNL